MDTNARSGAAGRPPATTAGRLEAIALQLFVKDGFDATTVDDIAAAAGIGRRTFFRYFDSKNDVVWGDFETGLAQLAASLRDSEPATSLADALTDAVVRFNRLPPGAVPAHRQRMALILRVPALQAHSTLQYAAWRAVISEFAAERLGLPVGSLRPQLVGHVALGAAVAAYEQWLADEQTDLAALLRESFAAVSQGLRGLAADRLR